MNAQGYFEPTQEAGAALFRRQINGAVVMLNLLRFRDTADYSEHPELDFKSSRRHVLPPRFVVSNKPAWHC